MKERHCFACQQVVKPKDGELSGWKTSQKEAIKRALQQNDNKASRAAIALGIALPTFRRHAREFGLWPITSKKAA